jgi:hypothetical protein
LSLRLRYRTNITVIIAALFGAIYIPALGHGFVKDDFRWIAAADVHSPSDVARIFSTDLGFYRPLVTLSFAFDRNVWGLDARGYALTNVLLLAANATLLFLLVRILELPRDAALVAAAVWAFNFHGINMALLWTSGRTALLLCLFAQASALLFLRATRWSGLLAGVLGLLAMLCKEEAVMLPPLFVALSLLVAREPRTLRAAILNTWPLWVAAAIYAVARAKSGAFGISDAPDYYRLTFDPEAVLKNVFEYLDRGATFAVVVSALFWLAAPFRAPLADDERRAIRIGIAWFIALYAVTVFVPVRSSLYAVAPSIGVALIAATSAARTARMAPRRFAHIAFAMIVVVAILIPVYRSRNHGLVEPADLAARSLSTIQAAARLDPSVREVILVDDPQASVTLDSAFGALFPDALHLFVGPGVEGSIVGKTMPRGEGLVFELRDGYLARISGNPAESSASHSG